MWSLPDIVSMNERAAQKGQTRRLERAVKTGKLDGEMVACEFCEKPATHRNLYFDIFSSDPKGIAAFCDEHDAYRDESYFDCVDCGRSLVLNYTWELYKQEIEDGTICLPCWAKRIIADGREWLALTPENIQNLDINYLRRRPHCIAVKMPVPEEIVFFANTEMDGSSGGRLTGFSSCESAPDGAVQELRESLEQLRERGITKALLILDAAYQFSISMGIYIPAQERRKVAA